MTTTKELENLTTAALEKFKTLPLKQQEEMLTVFDSFIEQQTDAEIKSILIRLKEVFTEAKMKTKKVADMSRDEIKEFIDDFIREYYAEFIEDYPKNREFVLGIFDEGLTHSPNPRIKWFWETLKQGFLEAEKTF